MAKPNRGKTIKLSIRLSKESRNRIQIAAENLGVSLAGVILFELSRLLKNPPSVSELEDLEQDITLERNHFVLTINEVLNNKINDLSERYDMSKNRLIGLIVSNFFERLPDKSVEDNTVPKKLMVQINENLKKKMMEYSEENFIPVSAIISYCVLNGPFPELPYYEPGKFERLFTNVPDYIGEIIKEEADNLNVKEHFYTSLCVYKQFMVEGGRFFE